MKQKRPEYYILYKDFNDGKIKSFDILKPLFEEILTPRGHIVKKKFHTFDTMCVGLDRWGHKKYAYKPINTKSMLKDFLRSNFREYWGRCEWEFVTVDYPYRTHGGVSYKDKDEKTVELNDVGIIEENSPHKIDGYDQLELNLPMITEVVWNYLEPEIYKMYGE